jgi:nucleoside-diphosphate-sugar epimerase
VYFDNLVSLIICCTHHPAAANQVFLVSDGHDLSTTELLRRTASALGVKSRLVPIPQKWIEFFAAIIGKKEVAQRLCGNLQVDITKARTLLEWTPPVTVEEGLRATALDLNKVNK